MPRPAIAFGCAPRGLAPPPRSCRSGRAWPGATTGARWLWLGPVPCLPISGPDAWGDIRPSAFRSACWRCRFGARRPVGPPGRCGRGLGLCRVFRPRPGCVGGHTPLSLTVRVLAMLPRWRTARWGHRGDGGAALACAVASGPGPDALGDIRPSAFRSGCWRCRSGARRPVGPPGRWGSGIGLCRAFLPPARMRGGMRAPACLWTWVIPAPRRATVASLAVPRLLPPGHGRRGGGGGCLVTRPVCRPLPSPRPRLPCARGP